ncbi:hypothetical protein [Rugamonas rivuli]|uniref:DUF4124 domain-containing protein n=1 Tax=Rugamonas rivuli TaxID=2743358 RepID=A0A843S7W6_9BURK|nr:hypothetical protein [Rugamonas rivuli]MQA18264.1 hypothetical protein [Rugamonas rivuli]
MDATLRIAQCLLCIGLVASTAYAAADVNRCISADGKVLLTDADCPVGSQSDASDDGSAGIAINSGGAAPKSTNGFERVAVVTPVAQLPRSPWADLPRPLTHKTIGQDAGTLQAAYLTMQMQDEMRRQRHVAALR